MKAFSQTSKFFGLKFFSLGLATVVLSGCDAETLTSTSAPDAQTTSVPTPVDIPAAPITPASPEQDGGIANPQPTRCDTVTYYSEILWEGNQPRMTLT